MGNFEHAVKQFRRLEDLNLLIELVQKFYEKNNKWPNARQLQELVLSRREKDLQILGLTEN